jgi:hypothetical protein
VSSKSTASRGNSRCGRIRLEVGSLSGQPGGDAISSVSRSSHHAGNRAVMRFRGGDSEPVVLGATRGGRSSESPSRPVERATVRRRFGRSREGSSFGYPDGGSNRRDSRPRSSFGQPRGDRVSVWRALVTRATGRRAFERPGQSFGMGNCLEAKVSCAGDAEGRLENSSRQAERRRIRRASRGRYAEVGFEGRARKRRSIEVTA